MEKLKKRNAPGNYNRRNQMKEMSGKLEMMLRLLKEAAIFRRKILALKAKKLIFLMFWIP